MKTYLLQLLVTLKNVQLMSGYNPLEDDDTTDRGCLDHSDCTMMGYKYGCLVYKCVDHSRVTPCHDQLECPQGQQCIRTYLPGYDEGVCVPDTSLQSCDSNPDCPCCAGWCCPQKYFTQWQNMDCVSHLQCRSWGTGQYCCPDSQCCNAMPSYDYYYDYDYYTGSQYSDYSTTVKYQDILYHYSPYATHKDDAVHIPTTTTTSTTTTTTTTSTTTTTTTSTTSTTTTTTSTTSTTTTTTSTTSTTSTTTAATTTTITTFSTTMIPQIHIVENLKEMTTVEIVPIIYDHDEEKSVSSNYYETIPKSTEIVNVIEESSGSGNYETSVEVIKDVVFFEDPSEYEYGYEDIDFEVKANEIEVSTQKVIVGDDLLVNANISITMDHQEENGSTEEVEGSTEEESGSSLGELEYILPVSDISLENVIDNLQNSSNKMLNFSNLGITEVRQFVSDISDRIEKERKVEEKIFKSSSSQSILLLCKNLLTSSLVIILAVIFS